MTAPVLNIAAPLWDAATTGTQFAQQVRDNAAALQAYFVVLGLIPGFDFAVTAGPPEQITQGMYTMGAYRVRVDMTWGTVGGALGNIKSAALYYSSDSGATFEPLADAAGKFVVSYSYDTAGNPTGYVWGNTP
jgi:hypothetical protein